MDNQVQVLARAFSVLEYLSNTRGASGPTEIARATGLSKSTVHRLLSSLHEMGYVEKRDDRTYAIGIKLVEIVSHHINNLELQTESRPLLNDLHNDLQLIVHLGILDGREVVYVEKMDILPNLRLYAQIGMRVPAFCSSLGKCLLARMPGDELDYLYSHTAFERYTLNSIGDLPALKAHLRQVRAQGWGMDDEEYMIGHRCVAAPVYDYRGESIAAVSASGPVSLLTDERLDEVKRRVMQTANEISRRLMYSG